MKKFLSVFVALLLVMTMFGTCALAQNKIFACPKSLTGDYWTFNGVGVMQFGEDFGVDVSYNGPTESNVQAQINMVYDAIENGANGILLAPNDMAAVEQVVTDAIDAGLYVVTWDADAAGPRTMMVNFAEDYELGCQIAESLIRQMGKEEGNVALLVGQAGASNHMTRAQGIRDTLAKYPGIEIVVEMDCDDSQDIALSNAQTILATYEDIAGFVTCSGAELPAACQAIQQAIDQGLIEAGTCYAAGSNTPGSIYEYLKEGVVCKEDLSSHPYQLGYAAAWMLNYLIENGGQIPEVGTVLDIGDDVFGSPLSLTMVSEELALTPLIVVTTENVDQFDF
ncbi:MAG: substrate-binding domain-containing protein [Clostridia bacterium]|nr:substrate-binding domain-containing protein [Clostridia bacterium]